MKHITLKKAGVLSASLAVLLAYGAQHKTVVLADPPAKIVWCHCEPNGNCETLNLPQAALENAGHVNASGNPLHAGDHAGQCVEVTPSPTVTPDLTPTATPILSPTVSPSPSPTPIDECEQEVCEPTATPSPTPVVEDTLTPTPTTASGNPGNPGGPGDGRSDGRSDGKSSCPECTKAPAIGGGDVLGVSTEGQVLGASTDFAATGTAVDLFMNILGSAGFISTITGIAMLKKKKSA